jgi:serine/threonine-protein kinase
MTDTGTNGGAFAKYRPIAELGQGGMAQVFLALASGPAGFNKLVVIKQIREQFADDPEFLTMFLDEARLAARLNHPNVVQTNEVGGDGKRFYICMEYLEGQPLNRIFSRVGPARGLTLGMSLRILVDALAGLHHAHELLDFDGNPLHVVHRDATPHNIFVTYAGQVKVVDFGIAKALSSSAETRTGVLKGKVAYMAPEQAMGEKVDCRADIFSVGMILWEVLTGKRLFKGMPDVAVLQKIVNGTLPSPTTVKPDVHPELDAICMKALAHKREDRYASAADMGAALEAAVDALGEKGSVRDAGRLIDQFFSGERARIKQLVEAQAVEGRALQDPSTFDPRLSGSGPKLPVFDDQKTVESISGSAVREPGSGPTRSGQVERPSGPSTLTAATAQAPSVQGAGKTRLYAAMGAAAIGAAVTVAFISGRGNGGAAAVPSAAPAADAPPKTHSVAVDSTPQGAHVREGDKELGTTPMTLEIDPAAAPRKLSIVLDGYAPHTFIPTREDTRITVPLSALAVPGATAPPEKAPAPDKGTRPVTRVVPVPPTPPPPTAKPPAPSDINTAR